MKIKTLFTIISIISLFLVLSQSYINFQKNYDLFLENHKYQSRMIADSVRYNISSMVDEMMYKFNSNQNLHEKIYYDTVDRILKDPHIKLEEIKAKLEEKYKDRVFDIYLINKDMVIYDATFKKDINLDFHNLPAALKIIKSVYVREKTIDISWPMVETFTRNYIQYYLHRPKGKDFMIQLSVKFDKDQLIDKYYDMIRSSTPSLINFASYSLYKSDYLDKVKVDNVLNKDFNDKNTILIKRERKQEFSKIYENIFGKSIPDNMEQIQEKLQNRLLKNDGYISYVKKIENYSIQTVILPAVNYQSLQDPSILANYIVMEFNITDQIKKMQLYKNQNILFAFLYFLVVVVLLYIAYKKILKPLYLLDDCMESSAVVKEENFLRKKDEISTMMRTYNNLFYRLNNEIDKNQILLDENKQFIADMVHQIRTPLTVIMTNSSFIEMESDKEIQQYIDQINSSINMLSNSYEDLSYIISNDTIEYKAVNINISYFLEDRIVFFDTIAKANEKFIVGDIEKNINLTINDTELERLIDNNISNAVKHSFDNSEIKIILKKEDDNILMQFISKGKHINNPLKLFEKNYTESNSSKRSLGLGLHMVKMICEKNSIGYSVESKNSENIFVYRFKI